MHQHKQEEIVNVGVGEGEGRRVGVVPPHVHNQRVRKETFEKFSTSHVEEELESERANRR